jgi:putative transposase
VQQLREAFPEAGPYRYMILDRDAMFGEEVTNLLTAGGLNPTRISPASPWQNGIAEKWVGSCRKELLDHLIVVNEAHLRCLMRDCISYYRADRIHDSLEKDTPAMRPVSSKQDQSARLVSLQRIGGLHHRYDWQQAA